MSQSRQIAIVGGGVIGLSLAWELASRKQYVTLFESESVGRKASWAGAGILSPSNSKTLTHPTDKLMGLGSDIHSQWTSKLKSITGIDNGYVECGGLYIARTSGEKAALYGQMLHWTEYEIPFRALKSPSQVEFAQVMNLSENDLMIEVSGESQICNPQHLKALSAACEKLGVQIVENCDLNFGMNADSIELVVDGEQSRFDQVCFCAGAWTTQILSKVGFHVPMIPVRGQMLLFKLDSQLFEPIINEGSRYLVPRRDGYVLVGSTTEEVGFDSSTTPKKLDELMAFANSIFPALNKNSLVKSWAGLRPASHDGFPFMGALPNCENGFVASGHFKAGLQMSPAVAICMASLMMGEEPLMEMKSFDPGRLDLSDSIQSG